MGTRNYFSNGFPIVIYFLFLTSNWKIPGMFRILEIKDILFWIIENVLLDKEWHFFLWEILTADFNENNKNVSAKTTNSPPLPPNTFQQHKALFFPLKFCLVLWFQLNWLLIIKCLWEKYSTQLFQCSCTVFHRSPSIKSACLSGNESRWPCLQGKQRGLQENITK